MSFPFQKVLNWYKKHGRHDLPWRQIYWLPDSDRLYKVWVAEVMLQQTQVDRVAVYYARFLEKYPTLSDLAKTDYDTLFPYWQWLGYYSRARRMIQLAQEVTEKYDGIFPQDYEKLRKLPGIGEYTAQALLAFWYDESILAVDANVQKIFSRYFHGSRYEKLSEKDIQTLQKIVKNQWYSWRELNNALMDLASRYNSITDLDDKYPLPDDVWFLSEWKNEVRIKKIVHQISLIQSLPRPDKSVHSSKEGNWGKKKSQKPEVYIVFLHENHKKYFSSHTDKYEPFLITAHLGNDRQSIQDYFFVTYGLEVSVRPRFWIAEFQGQVAGLYHAQIQTGKHHFQEFGKGEKEGWIGMWK